MMTGAQQQAQLMMDPNQMAQMIQQQQQIINQQSWDLPIYWHKIESLLLFEARSEILGLDLCDSLLINHKL